MTASLQSRLWGAFFLLGGMGATYFVRYLAATTGSVSFKLTLLGGVMFALGLYVVCLAPPIPIPRNNRAQFFFALFGVALAMVHWFFLTGTWSPL